MKKILIFTAILFAYTNVLASECIGSGAYRICTDSTKNSDGDETIRTHDNQGNSYSITSGNRDNPDGSTEVFSVDSGGNKYSIKSWCGSSGCHTEDSEGNKCTITKLGEMIGC